MFKSLADKEIYDASSLAFVFEFYTPLDKRKTAGKFSRALGKRVKWFKKPDASFEPTFETFKIAPIYSHGYKEISLSTGFMPYHEAVHMFLKVFNLIEAIGYTTDRCKVSTKIKLDSDALELSASLHELNKFKYLLGIDESRILKMWPSDLKENSAVAQNQLRFIQPRDLYNTVVTNRLVERMSPNEFSFPESEFFANDFSEIGRDNLVISYIRGKDYVKRKKESIETINYVIEHLYNTLKDNYSYSIEEKRKIERIVEEYKTAVNSTRTYLGFKSRFPEIELYVDLRGDQFLIESNYPIIREKIFKLIVGGGISEAIINYDTNRKALQIKNAKVSRSILAESIEFYDCELEIDAKNCLFDGCMINRSKLAESTVFSNNSIKNSKILDCNYLGKGNSIKASFLDNSEDKLINADLSECLVYNGRFSIDSTIDKNTTIIKKL